MNLLDVNVLLALLWRDRTVWASANAGDRRPFARTPVTDRCDFVRSCDPQGGRLVTLDPTVRGLLPAVSSHQSAIVVIGGQQEKEQA